MSEPASIVCLDDRRRDAVRAATLNGLDYLEVSEDQRTLTVYFLGKAPERIDERNVRVDGGRRVRDIQVTSVHVYREARPYRDDRMEVRVDRPGDGSLYVLRVVEPGRHGEPGDQPLHGFDERYASLEFSFKAGCPSDLDCVPSPACPEPAPRPIDVQYLARDYAGFRQALFDRFAILMPEWRERHVPDLGITLLELLAYAADSLAEMQDAVATEAYLDTARLRVSVRRHARLVDYRMHEGCNARAWLSIETDQRVDLPLDKVAFVTRFEAASPMRSIYTWEELSRDRAASFEVFEAIWPPRERPFAAIPARSRIRFYTWGDGECCLPAGATEATLRDEWIETPPQESDVVARAGRRARALDSLMVGDVLILEEVLGSRTASPADADPSHRHAVRLTAVQRAVDPLTHEGRREETLTPIVHVRWRREDALPFPLCLSSRRPAPDCTPLEDVSIARGNIVLVDHGRTTWEVLDPVPGEAPKPTCDPCEDVAPIGLPIRFEPTLEGVPLTYATPLKAHRGATGMSQQVVRDARPELGLAPMVGAAENPRARAEALAWTVVPDLLDSAPGDRHFVVEIDNEGLARLRFAREWGMAPAGGTRFGARYRVGNGPAGNVGAETIGLLVADELAASGSNILIRNPLPASGGTAPESTAEVKLFASGAIRRDRQRAVTAEDYAELAERDFEGEIQGAAAALCWNGSWYEARVGIDPLGRKQAQPRLLRAVKERLHRYRRIGHELHVESARTVPIRLTLDVCVAPHAVAGHVKQALLERFSSRRRRDGSLGFFHPDRLRYGEDVSVSAIVAEAQAVPGVSSLAVTELERLGEGPNQEIEKGVLRIGSLEIARLDNELVAPEYGVLTITTPGGR